MLFAASALNLSLQRVLVVLVVCLQTACTTQAWYQAARQSAEHECAKQQPGAYEECRARVNNQKYDDYEKARSGTKN